MPLENILTAKGSRERDPFKIALFQLSSQLDYKLNLEKIESAALKASSNGAKALFLPESFYSFSDGKSITTSIVTWKNEHFKNISKLASSNKIFILGGSVIFEEDGHYFNRCLNFNPSGELITYYDKINMFKISDPSITIDESRLYQRGDELKVVEFENFKMGLQICFDLRFSGLSNRYKELGCNLLSFSSAFTYKTGKDHWEILLKARAIESQSYVIACNQWGIHNSSVKTYGHSMVISPWGEILVNAGEGEKLVYAELDINKIEQVKNKIIME